MIQAGHESLIAQVAAYLLAIACRRAPGKRSFCGTCLTRVAERLESGVRRRFTTEEQRDLLELLPALYAGEAAVLADLSAGRRALLTRAEAILPAVRRTTGVRSADEDCLELALYILALRDPEPDGVRTVDIPDAGD